MTAATSFGRLHVALNVLALCVLLLLLLPQSRASSADEMEMDYANNHCKKIDLPHIYRKPGEPVYFSMEGSYDHFYYCKEQIATRVDCTPDLVDQICTMLARKRAQEYF
uniref:Chitin-binding protein n=1 Tax=Rhipicephalus appendiculatus TaxID=34631 RepID=A0A131YGM7_RHIAP